MNFSPEFFKKLKKAGFEIGEITKLIFDKKTQKEVESFVLKAEEAKKHAKKSKLIFGTFNA